MSILYTAVLFLILSYIAYFYFMRTFKYWESKHVPGPRPLPFFGNFKDFVFRKSTVGICTKRIYDSYPNEIVVGFYRMTRRSLLIRDLDVVKDILIKDFQYFEDRGIQFSETELGANLFHADAEIWRPLRHRFSPMFTTGKLKNMIPLINERAELFINHVNNITVQQTEQDIHLLMRKFTISSNIACVFGLDVNEKSEPLLKKLNDVDKLVFLRNFAPELDLLCPGVLRKLNASLFHKGLNDFFVKFIDDVLQVRNGVPSTRNDFIDLVLELKNEGNVLRTNKVKEVDNEIELTKLTKEVVAAQAFIFYIAGHEPNAIVLTCVLYELAMNPHIQEKLIAEVDETLERHDGKISYEMISELSYMEKVSMETLRKYPVSDLFRIAKDNYNIKGTNIIIEKGIGIVVPILGIHHDEKYYPDPIKFDPERFSPDTESQRHPCAFIPFGAGPRHCIGKLLARIQRYVCLIHFLRNFRVEVSENTSKSITLDPQRVINVPKGVLLNVVTRKGKQL